MEEEENKAQAPDGFELGSSRLQGQRSNHFGTITAREKILDLFTLVTPKMEETRSYAESWVDTNEDWRAAFFISLRLLCFILLEKGIRCQWHGWEREQM